MLHGHPSIRRRIKNAFQPQINKLKDELRALKDTARNLGAARAGPVSEPDGDLREKIRQMERKIADFETLQKSSNEHTVNKEVFLAEKMITQQKLENIQEDLEPLVEKMVTVSNTLVTLEDNDKKVINNFSGILDKAELEELSYRFILVIM